MTVRRWSTSLSLFVLCACATKSPQTASEKAGAGAHDQARTAKDAAELRHSALALLSKERTSPEDWQVHGPGALDALESIFRDTTQPAETRERAVISMALVDNARAPETLGRLVQDGSLEVVYRVAAVSAFADRAGQSAVSVLVPLLTGSEDALREAAAKALGGIGGAVAQSSLEAQLENETQPVVRDTIQQSLTKLQP